LGIGDWGLGIGDWGLGPIPNPQSPIPKPQTPITKIKQKNNKNIINYKLMLFCAFNTIRNNKNFYH
jgi:hypothetical protein